MRLRATRLGAITGGAPAWAGLRLNGAALRDLAQAIALTVTAKITGGRGASYKLNGSISGAGALEFGPDPLTSIELGGSNSYTGSTTISSGTIKVGVETTAFGSGSAVSVAAGATLDLNGLNQSVGSLSGAGTVTNSAAGAATLAAGSDNSSPTFSGSISDGAGIVGLIKNGSGTLTLTASSTYSGGTTVSAGTLRLTGIGRISSTSGVDVAAGAIFRLAKSENYTFAPAISGAGSVTHSAAVVTTLTGNSSYSGSTTISSGTLRIGDGGTTGDISSTSNIGVGASGTLEFNRSNTIYLSAPISSAGNVVHSGTGTTTLDASSSYAGGTTINAGTLRAGHVNAFGSGAITVNPGGTLDRNGFAIPNTIVNNGGSVIN